MVTVNFKINSKNYSVDCGEGQENQILSIAAQMDSKAKNIASTFGELDSETLLLMVCILTFGDMNKAKTRLSLVEKELAILKDNVLDEDAVSDFVSQLLARVKALGAQMTSEVYDSSIVQFK